MNWESPIPEKCEICEKPIVYVFYDAKTKQGPWASVCSECLVKYCRGMAQGKGQRYEKIGDQWVKTAG